MAADTVTGDVHVVECCRTPGDRGVTIVAGIVARDVCRVFAGSRDAIVTGTTNSDDLRMVDG